MLERVQKIISNAGYCSRRDAEAFIAEKRVTVNGKIIKLGDKADIEKDKITVNGITMEKTRKIYIMLNKPKKYITTAEDPFNRKKVTDLININERVFPVGRLDRDATGLLLLTNDGNFSNRIMHPRYEKDKTYFVKLDEELKKQDKEQIEKGIMLVDGFVKAKIKMISKNTLEITVREGRNKIIKRIFHRLKYNVDVLARTRIGNLKLDVKQGRWRFLNRREVEDLMK